ncbi:hypothetical protein PFISCL1PPCAC_18513, partial [Pristionchus fissidentatus]
IEVYRSSLYKDFVDHTIRAVSLKHINVDTILNTQEDHPALLEDLTNNKKFSLWGDNAHNNAQQTLTADSQLLHVTWSKAFARSAFMMRFTVSDYVPSSSTTAQPTTSEANGVSFVISSIFLLLLSL